MTKNRRRKEPYRVFIGHSSRDRWVCERIKECVEATGAVAWLDATEIPVGGAVPERVINGIRSSDELLVLLSPAIKLSEWVLAEVGMAMLLHLRVAPVLLHADRHELPGIIRDKNPIDINQLATYLHQLRERVTAGTTRTSR